MIANATELLQFLRRYHHSLLEQEPPRPVELPSFLVPQPLRGLHELFGHHIGPSWGPLSSQDDLISAEEMRLDGEEVFFLNENQSCWSCTYSLTPPHPVFRYDGGPAGVRQTDTLEEFLISFALQEAVMSSPWLLGIHGAESPESLRAGLVDLYREGRYAYDGPTHDFWITPDQQTLCMNTEGAGLWLASYSERVLDLRMPDFEYQVVSPRDYSERTSPTLLKRLAQWFRS